MWSALAAVTEEVSVPLVLPDTALTVRVKPLLDAPGASTTEPALSVEALKFVLSLSLAVRVKVSFAHAAVSLFVIDKV